MPDETLCAKVRDRYAELSRRRGKRTALLTVTRKG